MLLDVLSDWQPCPASPKRAAGLMQLMPPTAITFGVANRFREENIRGNVAYLAYLIRQFEGELRVMAAGYYAGESRITNTDWNRPMRTFTATYPRSGGCVESGDGREATGR